jgi:hypothetical protein
VLLKWFKQYYIDNNIHILYDFIAMINKIIPNPNDAIILRELKKDYTRNINREIWELYKDFDNGKSSPTRSQCYDICMKKGARYRWNDDITYSFMIIKISIHTLKEYAMESNKKYNLDSAGMFQRGIDSYLGPDPHVIYENQVKQMSEMMNDINHRQDFINIFYENTKNTGIKYLIKKRHQIMYHAVDLFDSIELCETYDDIFKVNCESLCKILLKCTLLTDDKMLYRIINHVTYIDNEKYTLLKLLHDRHIMSQSHYNKIIYEVVKNTDISVLKFFLEQNVDINSPDDEGFYPLHIAISFNNAQFTSMLIKAGANIECTDNENETPLIMAIEIGSYEIVKILLDANANIEFKYNSVDTPLEFAMHNNQPLIAQLLKTRYISNKLIIDS